MQDVLVYLLKNLSEIAPVIISLGNHDLSIKDELELRESFRELKTQNVYPLDNESIEFDDIYFTGYFARRDAYAVSYMSKRKMKIVVDDLKKNNLLAKSDKFSNLLCHNPYIILSSIIKNEFLNIYDYDLISAGHCHNGMFSFKTEQELINRLEGIINRLKDKENIRYKKLINFLESLKSFGIIIGPAPFTLYARGLHDLNGTKLFISRGVTNQNKGGDSFITETNIIPKLK